MKNVARRIKSIRESKGISQDELADNLHLSLEQLADLENGVTKLTTEQITEFATALEVTEEYLRLGNTQNNTLNHINDSSLEGSNVTTTHSTTTNNYYGDKKQENNLSELERNHLQAQLNRIEQKLDFIIQRL